MNPTPKGGGFTGAVDKSVPWGTREFTLGENV